MSEKRYFLVDPSNVQNEHKGIIEAFTHIYATRPGYPSPLIIGLIRVGRGNEKRVICQLVDCTIDEIAIGQEVEFVLRRSYELRESLCYCFKARLCRAIAL